MASLSNLLRENMFTPEEVPAFEKKLFFEGARRRPYRVRFTVLLLLATIIATGGILADSTATVIGAMIIAPLMTPIMATAAALVMGSPKRATYSILLVGAGVAGVIAVSWLWGLIYPGVISTTANSQIAARVSPRLVDLIVALASGAAGAFAMSREDVADSLPGVAIAISLVPPLCVVGITLSAGEWDAASGAMILFLTNFLSILLAGGSTLALLGLGRVATRDIIGHTRRNAYAVIILGILLVAVPLSITGRQITFEANSQYQASRIAKTWVEDTDYDVRVVDVAGNDVYVLISGAGTPPLFDSLVTELEASLARPVDVKLEIAPVQKEEYVVSP